MDPLVQKGIDQKWLFDTQEEASAAAHLLYYLPNSHRVLYDGMEYSAVFLPHASGASVEVEKTSDGKFQVFILIFVDKNDKPIEPKNPYGASLLIREATFVFQ